MFFNKEKIRCYLFFLSLLVQLSVTALYAQDALPTITTDCSTLDQDVSLRGQCEWIVPDLSSQITATAAVGVPTLSQLPAAGTVLEGRHGETTTITITATDNAGLSASCKVNLTVKDTDAPVFVELCSVANRNVNLTNYCEIVVPDLTNALTTTDNCDSRITVIQQPLAGSILHSQHDSVHYVKIRAIDDAGFSSSCTVELTAVDRIAPILLADCNSLRPVAQLGDYCQVVVPNLINDLSLTENCDEDVVLNQYPAANAVINVSENDPPTVAIIATDRAGNSSECIVTLEIQDTIAPLLLFDCDTLPREVVLDNDCMITIPNFVDSLELATIDNCSSVSLTQFPEADSLMSLNADGKREVVITATDESGNRTSCTVVLESVEATVPTIVTDCRELDWVARLTSNCKVVIPNFIPAIVTSGGCSDVTVTQFPLPGASVDSEHNKIHEIVITATDEGGASSSCTINLKAKDRTKPTISRDCADLDRSVDLSVNCTMIVPDLSTAVEARDNCEVGDVTVTQIPAAGTELAIAEGETVDVAITVTDIAGNSTNCAIRLTATSGAVNIFDGTCGQEELAVALREDCTIAIPNVTEILPAFASCGLEVTYTQSPAAGSIVASAHNDTHEVSIVALLSDNSSSTCTVVLTATDRTAPVFSDCTTVPQSLNMDATCTIVIPDLLGAVALSDCAEISELVQSPAAGSIVSTAHDTIHNVTITATDIHGNTNTCVVPLIAKDNTIPTIVTNCGKLDQTIALTDDCSVVIPDLASLVEATDNCSNELTIFQSPTPGTRLASYDGAQHRVMIIVLDGAENPRTCAAFLNARDVTAPTIENCSELAQEIVLDENCKVVMPDLRDQLEITENCEVTVTVEQYPAVGEVIDAAHGELIGVAFLARDSRGNRSTCTTTLTAVDRIMPRPLPREIVVALDSTGVAVITGEQLDAGSTDNCGIANFMVEPDTFTMAGTYEVLFSVADAAGNKRKTSTFVTVIDASGIGAPPLEVSELSVAQLTDEVKLEWAMASVKSDVQYQLEWRVDGQPWTSITTVETKINQNLYKYQHQHPVSGRNYYRLLEVGADGKKQYSAIVDIWIKSISEAAVTTFYPNPTTGLVQVELSEAFDRTLPVQLRLYNSTGQLVQEQQLSASENLDLSAVMAGVYHIEIIQNSTRATARILRIE